MSLGLSAAAWTAIGAVGTVGVGLYGANKAANAQESAAQQAGQVSNYQFDRTREDQLALLKQQREDSAPYRESGYKTLAQIMAGVSPGGEFAQKFDPSMLPSDPGYQFRLSQGESGIRRAAAASGSAYSGATLKALARFNSGLASQEYGDAYNRFTGDQAMRFNRLASVAGLGQTAVGQTQQAGTNAYGTIASLGANNAATMGRSLQDAAEARASGYVASANGIGQGIKSLYNAFAPTGPASGTISNILY